MLELNHYIEKNLDSLYMVCGYSAEDKEALFSRSLLLFGEEYTVTLEIREELNLADYGIHRLELCYCNEMFIGYRAYADTRALYKCKMVVKNRYLSNNWLIIDRESDEIFTDNNSITNFYEMLANSDCVQVDINISKYAYNEHILIPRAKVFDNFYKLQNFRADVRFRGYSIKELNAFADWLCQTEYKSVVILSDSFYAYDLLSSRVHDGTFVLQDIRAVGTLDSMKFMEMTRRKRENSSLCMSTVSGFNKIYYVRKVVTEFCTMNTSTVTASFGANSTFTRPFKTSVLSYQVQEIDNNLNAIGNHKMYSNLNYGQEFQDSAGEVCLNEM